MKFLGRRLVKSEDLNPADCLFGGTLLRWLDEEAYIYACCQLDKSKIVTASMTEINFRYPSVLGDIIEFGMKTQSVGRSSIAFSANVRNKVTKKTVLEVEKIVMVLVDDHGKATPHGKTLQELAAQG